MTAFSDWLAGLLQATAWPMTPPQAYGPFHLTFTLVGFALSLLLAWKLRNIGEKRGKILLLCLGAFLLLTEIYKQLFHYYCYGERGYKWWIFPFQMCSVPMYLCLIAPLLKPGPVRKGMYNFMMIYNLLGGFIAFFEPSGLNHDYWSLTLHSYMWHMLLVFIGLFLSFAGLGGKTMKDYKYASVTFVALCGVAFCINLLFFDVSGGSINMFFVGPANSSLIVFKDIAEKFGWYVSTLLYIPVVCLGAFGIFLPFHLLDRKKQALAA